VDISVFALNAYADAPGELPLTIEGLTYGQDAYFLGFPYGVAGEVNWGDWNLPMPFVKRATVSLMDTDKNKPLFLDGHNNPGFSGGPVVFWSRGTVGVGNMRVAAVVSGFLSQEEPIRQTNAIYDGKLNSGPKYAYDYNTGIIEAHRIHHAVDLIRANPIGPSAP
jgi:hypothetical protein